MPKPGGVTEAEWQAVAEILGDKDIESLVLISGVDDDDFDEARRTAKLSAFRRAALTLMFAAIKAKFSIRTRFNELAPAAAPPGPAGTTVTQAATSAPAPSATVVRINLGQILNQALSQEVPLLDQTKLTELRSVYTKREGDEPIEGQDASNA